MSDETQLEKMGIRHPDEICSFVVNSISGIDVLRINYKRKKGSLLPTSRSYEFPRVQREYEGKKGKKKTVMETAPALRQAVTELKQLINARTDKPEIAASILDELEALEHEMAWRIEHIRSIVNDD